MAAENVPTELRVGRAGNVLVLELDAPHSRNALTTSMLDAIAMRVEQCPDDIRSIVLTAQGRTFSSGSDLKELSSVADRAESFARAFQAIEKSAVPVLAAVGGDVYGAAIGLVATCDVVVVSVDAAFAFREILHGTVATMAAVPCVRRAPSGLAQFLLTGRRFDAAHAQALGLADAVVTSAELDDTVHSYCHEIASGAPGAVAATKQLLAALTAAETADPYAVAVAETLRLATSPEVAEGRLAFTEHRPPAWS